MIIRHGEKPDKHTDTRGIDATGHPGHTSLHTTGWQRARALVTVFDPANGELRPGLATPTTIYAARANGDGEGARTRETVAPLAAALRIPVNTHYGKGDEPSLVEHADLAPGPILICWQHGEIPAITHAFAHSDGPVTPTPTPQRPNQRFDVVWTFTKTSTGWHFTQVPELALPRDQPTTIRN
jgi:hypothetical protein